MWWTLVLVVVPILSCALSAYAWYARPSWPLQLVAATSLLVTGYSLIYGGRAYIAAIDLGLWIIVPWQLVLAARLYHRAHSKAHR